MRLNDDNEIECFSLDGKNCTTDNLGNDVNKCSAYITANLKNVKPIVCTEDEYNTPGHWCQKVAALYYDKFLCNSLTGLNTGVRIKSCKKKIIECLSVDGMTCSTNDGQCKSADPKALGLNLDYWFRKSEPFMDGAFAESHMLKLKEKKMFLYRQIILLPDISVAASDNNTINVLTIPLTKVKIPHHLTFAKFKVYTPAVGVNFKFNPNNFTKEKLVLKINDKAISMLGKVDNNLYKSKSFAFEGIIKSIRKGEHVFSIDFYGAGFPSIMSGELFFQLEGYY